MRYRLIQKIVIVVLVFAFLFQIGCQVKTQPPARAPKETPAQVEKTKPTFAKTEIKPLVITITAVGDVMLARGIEEKINQFRADYPFQMISPFLSRADLCLANLECAVTDEGKPIGKSVILAASPQVL
ncbi:MAG: CapA family protein, partial [Candidatus Subteraquimicrobiales bacterium]|nr:CapA family protein [Candidatus Subteraquimicrobiales bacterium]